MTVTIGSATVPILIAQPFGYEGDARQGLTARRWLIQGICTRAEWLALLSQYNSWRDTRITDADTLSSGTVGTTVSFTGTGYGESWSSIACWFTRAPEASQLGNYVQVSIELVHAAEALQALLRGLEKDRQRSEALRPSFGTETLGSATLTLISQPEGFQDGPRHSVTAAGSSYIQGTRAATSIRTITGTTDATGWGHVKTWYTTTIASTPAVDSWFPITEPSATAEVQIISGAKSTVYTVTVTLAQIR